MRQSSLAKKTGGLNHNQNSSSGSIGLGYNRILEFTQTHLKDKKVINPEDIDSIQEKIENVITSVNQGINTHRSGSKKNSPSPGRFKDNKEMYYAVSPSPSQNKKALFSKRGASTTARDTSIDIAKFANTSIMTPTQNKLHKLQAKNQYSQPRTNGQIQNKSAMNFYSNKVSNGISSIRDNKEQSSKKLPIIDYMNQNNKIPQK